MINQAILARWYRRRARALLLPMVLLGMTLAGIDVFSVVGLYALSPQFQIGSGLALLISAAATSTLIACCDAREKTSW